jgi:hypothetical protein
MSINEAAALTLLSSIPSHSHDTPLDPFLLRLLLAQGCVGLGDTQQNHFFCDEIHSETSGDMLPNEL